MNATASANPIADALKATASLLEISSTALGVTRKDKIASAKMDNDQKAANGTTSANINRLSGAKDLHDRFKNKHSEIRANAEAFTTRWSDGGQRLLPHVNLEPWAVRHKSLINDHDELLRELQRTADDIIAQARRSLGDYADRIDPPTREELLKAYTVMHKISPFPDDAGFNHLPPQTAAMLKQQWADNAAASFRQGQEDYLKRLAKPIDHLVKALETYDQREKDIANGMHVGKAGNFQDTSLGNVQDVLAMLPSLNLLNDPRMVAIADRLKLLMGVDTKRLKSEPDTRAKAIADMKSAFEDSLLPGL